MRPFLPLLILVLSACSPVYKLAVSQGNVIDDKKLAQLEPGMTPEQVRFLMGTPLVRDEFQPARWDYTAYYRGPDGREQRRNVSLYFADGLLQRYEDSHPPAAEPVPLPAPGPAADGQPAPETPADSG